MSSRKWVFWVSTMGSCPNVGTLNSIVQGLHVVFLQESSYIWRNGGKKLVHDYKRSEFMKISFHVTSVYPVIKITPQLSGKLLECLARFDPDRAKHVAIVLSGLTEASKER